MDEKKTTLSNRLRHWALHGTGDTYGQRIINEAADKIEELEARVEPLQPFKERILELQSQVDRECEWKDDEDGIWYGTCGIAWCFDSGEMKDNNCNFCPQCGGKITEAAIKGASDG